MAARVPGRPDGLRQGVRLLDRAGARPSRPSTAGWSGTLASPAAPALARGDPRARPHSARPAGAGQRTGSSTWKRVSPGSDCRRSSPWWRTTMRCAMSSPRPVPCPTGLVVKKASKIRDLQSRRGSPARCRPISTQHPLALPARAQRDPPAAAERVDRVVDQVRPHLVQLGARCLDARQIGVEVADDLDLLLPQLVAQQRERALEALRGCRRSGAAPGRGTSSS